MGTTEAESLEILTLFPCSKVVSIFADHIACCLAKYMSTEVAWYKGMCVCVYLRMHACVYVGV